MRLCHPCVNKVELIATSTMNVGVALVLTLLFICMAALFVSPATFGIQQPSLLTQVTQPGTQMKHMYTNTQGKPVKNFNEIQLALLPAKLFNETANVVVEKMRARDFIQAMPQLGQADGPRVMAFFASDNCPISRGQLQMLLTTSQTTDMHVFVIPTEQEIVKDDKLRHVFMKDEDDTTPNPHNLPIGVPGLPCLYAIHNGEIKGASQGIAPNLNELWEKIVNAPQTEYSHNTAASS